MNELRLIGEQQEPAGVLVESADACDGRIALTPARREERVDVRSFALVVRADETEWFVESQQETLRAIEGLAVDANVGGFDLGAEIVRFLPTDSDRTCLDPRPRIAPAAIAEVGEKLIEAAHEDEDGRGFAAEDLES